jgi:hypothetical protein
MSAEQPVVRHLFWRSFYHRGFCDNSDALVSHQKNFIEALEKLERKAFEDGYHFSGNPVAYRPPRNN